MIEENNTETDNEIGEEISEEEEAEKAEEANAESEEEHQEPESKDDVKDEAPAWVKELREINKTLKRENKELMALVPPKEKPTLRKKPSLDDDDINYDQELYEKEIIDWLGEKKAIDDRGADEEAKVKKQQEEAAQEATAVYDAYEKDKERLGHSDFEEAQLNVESVLTIDQQNVLLTAADSPAEVVYALHNDQNKAFELSKITNPLKLAVAIAKLEATLKTGNRKPSSKPEGVVRGGAALSGQASSKRLEAAIETARASGNYQEVLELKRKLKN